MLHLIHGEDREKGRAKFRTLRESLSSGEMNIEHVQEGTISEKVLHEMSAARGLFGGKTLFIFDTILEKKEEQEIFALCAEMLGDSENYFLVFEPSLSKDSAKNIIPHTTEHFEYSLNKKDERSSFNIFSLGDALGERNKKELWVLYQKAIGAELSSEEICGTLFWMIKNMALMKQSKKGNDVGLNPFVAKKTRGFAERYTGDEIISLSHAIVSLYHEAHRGGEPMDIALERFILSL